MKFAQTFVKCAITCLWILLTGSHLSAQIRFEGYGNGSAQAPISQLYQFLKNTPTTKLPEELLQPSKCPLYDSVIGIFFDTTAMVQQLSRKDVDVRIQYQALYGIDKSIDQIPADSVFAMPAGYFYSTHADEKPEAMQDVAQRHVIGYIIAGKHYPMLDICLADNKRFAYIMPFIYFDREKGKVIEEFTLRYRKEL